MATPDHVNEIFEDTHDDVEVRGDYVHLTILSRFGEVIIDCQMTADEADDLAAKLLDAVAVIDTRNGPTPEQIAEEAVTAINQAVDQPWRNLRANPTFSQAVDELLGAPQR